MKRKDVLDYERDIYALKEIAAQIYFIFEHFGDDCLEGRALGGVFNQLDITAQKIEELFELAIELQKAQNSK